MSAFPTVNGYKNNRNGHIMWVVPKMGRLWIYSLLFVKASPMTVSTPTTLYSTTNVGISHCVIVPFIDKGTESMISTISLVLLTSGMYSLSLFIMSRLPNVMFPIIQFGFTLPPRNPQLIVTLSPLHIIWFCGCCVNTTAPERKHNDYNGSC